MNKGVYVVQNGKLKKVIASGYGDGLVKTVNGIEPDQRGDVDLGEIASPTDVEVAKDNAIKTARDLAKVDMEMATEGIRGFMHRGVWASGVEYEKNNLVIYNESVYQAVKDIKDSDKEVEVEEPETEVEDSEDIAEEVEDTEEPTEPTDEPNPVEINPEDEEFGKMYWRMFAPKTKERPRGTYAEAVNGIVPDETGNIELGQLAMLGDVSDGIDLAVERSGNYTDEQIELIKQEGIGGEVSKQDLDDAMLEAKDHANIVADSARYKANKYTDEELNKLQLGMTQIIKSTTLPPEDTGERNWDLWLEYDKPEGLITLEDVPLGELVDVEIVLDGIPYRLQKVSNEVYGQGENILQFATGFTNIFGYGSQNLPESERHNWHNSNLRAWLNAENSEWLKSENINEGYNSWFSKDGFLHEIPIHFRQFLLRVEREYDYWAGKNRARTKRVIDLVSLPTIQEMGFLENYEKDDWFSMNYNNYPTRSNSVFNISKENREFYHDTTMITHGDNDSWWKHYVNVGVYKRSADKLGMREKKGSDSVEIKPIFFVSKDMPVSLVDGVYYISGTKKRSVPVKQIYTNILV